MLVAAMHAPPEPQLSTARTIDVALERPKRPRHERSRHERLRVRSAAVNVLAGHPASVTGRLRPSLSHRRIALRVFASGRWIRLAYARTGAKGRFRIRYTARRVGSWPADVRFEGGEHAVGTTHPLGRLNSYRLAAASWYGGAGPLACGGYLTSATVGVANKTLPCGTWLTLRYAGHSVRVQVIDRGPYVAGREFDLTEATKRDLGFSGVGEVWATR